MKKGELGQEKGGDSLFSGRDATPEGIEKEQGKKSSPKRRKDVHLLSFIQEREDKPGKRELWGGETV